MKAPKFAKRFSQLPLLSQPQRQQVLAALHPASGLDRVVALIDEIRSVRGAVRSAPASVVTGTVTPTTCNVFAVAPADEPSTT